MRDGYSVDGAGPGRDGYSGFHDILIFYNSVARVIRTKLLENYATVQCAHSYFDVTLSESIPLFIQGLNRNTLISRLFATTRSL